MVSITELEKWYLSQCDENWEHTYGVEIGTLDNPGWFLKVDLSATKMEGKDYEGYSYGLNKNSEPINNNWLVTKLENGKFVGYGGPLKLNELIKLFLTWADSNA